MRKDIDIDSLMADTWLTVAQLRHGARAPDGQALYKNCCVQVESVREALEWAVMTARASRIFLMRNALCWMKR